MAHAHSTPRAPHSGRKGVSEPSFAEYPSPYEALKAEMAGEDAASASQAPITPGKPQALPDMSMTPDSSPFVLPTTSKKKGPPPNNDPLLHRVLDRTYRIAATPHTGRKQKASAPVGTTPGTASRGRAALPRWADDSSPICSPAPQLRADLFLSPLKGPRTPGISVQTPGKKNVFESRTKDEINWESDSDDEGDGLDFSPPKTMQFHIPQSRLMQTPGKHISWVPAEMIANILS